MKSKARRAIASQDGSSSARRVHQAAIIRPFQSASTLSSSPGRTRPPRARAKIRAGHRAAPRRHASAARALSRLRILWPSKLPSVAHVVVPREEFAVLGAEQLDRSRPSTRRRTCPPRLRCRRRARRQRPPLSSVISRTSQPTVSCARSLEHFVAAALKASASSSSSCALS